MELSAPPRTLQNTIFVVLVFESVLVFIFLLKEFSEFQRNKVSRFSTARVPLAMLDDFIFRIWLYLLE